MTKVQLLSCVSACGLLAFWAGGAAAAAAPAEVDEVVVTGSLIAGTPKDTAIPVSVTTHDELEKRGSPNVVEIVKQLPIGGPSWGDSNQWAPNLRDRTGMASINLRGLGEERTLLLMNGKRFSSSYSDLNLLPIGAVGRVEILKDGAAATYGSDAIAGVVNFITRSGFRGLELTADYRYVNGSRGDDYSAGILYGWGDDRFDALVSLNYLHRSEVPIRSRDWSEPDYYKNPTPWSIYGQPGEFTLRGGPAGTGANLGQVQDANCTAVGGAQNWSGTLPICRFTYTQFENLVEEQDQYQAYAEFNARIGDTSKFHVEALYTKTSIPRLVGTPSYPTSVGPNGPASADAFYVPASNPGFNTALAQTGKAALIGVAQSATLTNWRPIGNGGNPYFGDSYAMLDSRLYDLFRIVADLSGETGVFGTKYDASVTYIRQRLDSQAPDIFIDRLQRALNGLGGPNCTGSTPGANGCQYFNPFSNAYAGNPIQQLTNPGYVSANANSTELIGWMFDRLHGATDTTTVVGEGVLSGKLPITLPGGEIGWAAGGQYRNISFIQRVIAPGGNSEVTPCPIVGSTTCAVRTGPYIFLGQRRPLDLEQNIWAAFAELNIPVTDRLNAQVAIRHEDYGGQVGATTNPQLRAKWQATDWLTLRGSVGSSFRGPTFTDVAPTGNTLYGNISALGSTFRPVDQFGNPDVKPEKALTYSVGTVLKVGNLYATVDYWSYRVKDQITNIPGEIVARAVFGSGDGTQIANCASPLRNLLTFGNNNTCTQGVTRGLDVARIRSDVTNGPTIKTSGLDFDVSYRIDDVLGGDAEIGGTATHVFKFKQDAFIYNGIPVSPAYEAAGFTNYDRLSGTIAKTRAQLFADYGRGPHHLRWTTNYVSGVTDNRGPRTVQTGPSTNCSLANARAGTAINCAIITWGAKVRPFISHDLVYRINLDNGFTVTAAVMNILDRDPSKARLEAGYDPFIGNPLGRSFKVSAKKTF